VNGAVFKAGADSKPADVYSEVVKVIEDGEGSAVLYLRPLELRKTMPDGSVKKIAMKADARPFVPEATWTMFDAEGNETQDAHFALKVIMPYAANVEDTLYDVIWNECAGPVSGNYTGLPCNKKRGLADDYMAFLKQNFLTCVNSGMKLAGVQQASSVHIQHDGTMADARHNRGSLHAAGRAVDVMLITAYDENKKPIGTFDFRKTNTDRRLSRFCKPQTSTNCIFWEAFRSCWHKVNVARKCPGRHGGPLGTIGWEDRDHIAHHLHTSMPFCPNNKGYYITESK
jgi:hypothetical protein